MAAWKLIGGLAGIGAIGAGLATIVVMCVLRPRTQAEWTVGIISTVMGSISGGAFVVQYYELQEWAASPFGLVAMLGLVFACGLPAWAIVRWSFNYINKHESADIAEIVSDARKLARGE
ncbi:hypothetical protein C4E04_11875 [Microvirga sp. 17 mud 1-3]|nr:hypothetical protein C4E04_11875 [Microvirga sp. 17 mud 1-3]